MSDTEWVYSLFTEANPIPDPERFLASRSETDLLVIEGSQVMDTEQLTEVPATEPGSLRRVAAIAFAALIVVVGVVAGVALLTGNESGVASGGGDTPIGGLSDGAISNVYAVTFDGNECTYMGPTEVPPGDYAFLFTDASDLGAVLFARMIVDGHTYQDVLDAWEEAGGNGSYVPRPSWVAQAPVASDPPEIDLADNQQLLASRLYPGEHFVALWTTEGPELNWLCAPLDVVEP